MLAMQSRKPAHSHEALRAVEEPGVRGGRKFGGEVVGEVGAHAGAAHKQYGLADTTTSEGANCWTLAGRVTSEGVRRCANGRTLRARSIWQEGEAGAVLAGNCWTMDEVGGKVGTNPVGLVTFRSSCGGRFVTACRRGFRRGRAGGGVAGAQAGRRVPGQGGQVRWTLLWVPQGFMCEVQVLCVST